MASARTITWFLGCALLAALAVLVPLVVPSLVPGTATRTTTIGAVIVAESIVLLAIAIAWVAMRAARTRRP